MQNINRWRSDQFQPPFYLESGQFDTRGLSLHSTNVVICLNWHGLGLARGSIALCQTYFRDPVFELSATITYPFTQPSLNYFDDRGESEISLNTGFLKSAIPKYSLVPNIRRGVY